jgi:hypothetical protein
MKHGLILVPIVAVVALSGCCTGGLSNGSGRDNYSLLVNGSYSHVKDDAAPAKRPELPLRLAVAETGEAAPSRLFVDALQKNGGVVQSVVPIPMPGDSWENHYSYSRKEGNRVAEFSRQIESARRLARDSGADFLLLIGGSIDGCSESSPASVFDLTLVGMWIVPSNQLFTNGKAAWILMDTETGRVVRMSSVEDKNSSWSASAYQGDRLNVMRMKMRDELLQKLAQDIKTQLLLVTPSNKQG